MKQTANLSITQSSISYWNKFIPDILLLIFAFFFSEYLMEWQLQHLQASCFILMILNILAVGFGCFNFFSLYADTTKLNDYKDSLSTFQSALLGISAFISCLAFLWWLVPFSAAKSAGVTETGFIFGATIYFTCFIAVVATSINNKKNLQFQQLHSLKIPIGFITGFFFFFSYSFLLVTMHHWQPTFFAARFAAIICLIIFYLPLRFFLLLRPPFHKLEYFLFIVSFFYMLYKLFVQL